MGSDEFYTYESNLVKGNMDRTMMGLSFGRQNTTDPIGNVWDGHKANQSNNYGEVVFGVPLYKAIRDCNVFLENVHRPYDLEEYERARWIAEVKFLKAYYHFYLMRCYGPIVLIKENQSVSSTPEEMALYRSPFDECVDYVCQLLDEAAAEGALPIKIQDRSNEMGRATKSIALSLKARILTMAASPLFNGNPDYANVIDNKGVHLFSAEYDAKKWQRAADACKAAIVASEAADEGLLFDEDVPIVPEIVGLKVDTLRKQYNLRAIILSRWNKETIWGSVNADFGSIIGLQVNTACKISTKEGSQEYVAQKMVPTLEVAESFYTSRGVPMEEDNKFDDTNRYELRKATAADKWYIKEGEYTASMHFDREARFYAAIGFDRAIWWGNGVYDFKPADYGSSEKVRYIRGLADNSTNEVAGKRGTYGYSVTGYWAKKLNNPLSDTAEGADKGWGGDNKVSFPIIRVADLYLMYAETLNEANDTPPEEVYTYLDLIRKRAGLEGVKESWRKYSKFPEKPLSKVGLRDIIRRERRIELSMEGSRFWDLRRWKEAEEDLNKPVRTWNINGVDKADYYRVITVDVRSFTRKEYLWPIKEYNLTVNKNLVQNYGW